MEAGRVDRDPPGSVRYGTMEVKVDGKSGWQVMELPANGRNSQADKAVLTPEEWGVVFPFRWVEVAAPLST